MSLYSGLQVDVSICNDSGLKAVQYLQQGCTTLPALRPLVLVLKLLLREHSLNDVATGGLGSWALANMVMAHLKVRSSSSSRLKALLGCNLLSHCCVASGTVLQVLQCRGAASGSEHEAAVSTVSARCAPAH